MLLIDKYAYFNRYHNVNPIEKMVFSIGLLLFSLIVREEIIACLTFCLMSGMIVIGAKIPLHYYVKLITLPGFFLLTSLVSILFSVATTDANVQSALISFELGPLSFWISYSSIKTAIELFWVVLASISCLYFLILTTPIQSLCYVLRRWHVPSLFVDLMELTYHFIFVFLESAHKIYVAQQSRLAYQTFLLWLRSISLLISALFVELIHRSKELSNAMLARGGETHTNVYVDSNQPYSLKKWLLMISIFCLFGIIYVLFGGNHDGRILF